MLFGGILFYMTVSLSETENIAHLRFAYAGDVCRISRDSGLIGQVGQQLLERSFVFPAPPAVGHQVFESLGHFRAHVFFEFALNGRHDNAFYVEIIFILQGDSLVIFPELAVAEGLLVGVIGILMGIVFYILPSNHFA